MDTCMSTLPLRNNRIRNGATTRTRTTNVCGKVVEFQLLMFTTDVTHALSHPFEGTIGDILITKRSQSNPRRIEINISQIDT